MSSMVPGGGFPFDGNPGASTPGKEDAEDAPEIPGSDGPGYRPSQGDAHSLPREA